MSSADNLCKQFGPRSKRRTCSGSKPFVSFIWWKNNYAKAKISEQFMHKIVINFLSISLNICFGAKKNRLNETVLLRTHIICFS